MNLPRLDKYTSINFILYINIFLFFINIIYYYLIVPASIVAGKLDPYFIENIALIVTVGGLFLIPFEFFYKKRENNPDTSLNIGVVFFILINIYFFTEYIETLKYCSRHFFQSPPANMIISIVLAYAYCTRHLPKLNKYITVNLFYYNTLFIAVIFLFTLIVDIFLGYIEVPVFHNSALTFCTFIYGLSTVCIITSVSIFNIFLLPIELLLKKINIFKIYNEVQIHKIIQIIIGIISIIIFIFATYLLVDMLTPHPELD